MLHAPCRKLYKYKYGGKSIFVVNICGLGLMVSSYSCHKPILGLLSYNWVSGDLMLFYDIDFCQFREFEIIEGDYYELTYFRPWSRASTYFLGMARKPQWKLARYHTVFLVLFFSLILWHLMQICLIIERNWEEIY